MASFKSKPNYIRGKSSRHPWIGISLGPNVFPHSSPNNRPQSLSCTRGKEKCPWHLPETAIRSSPNLISVWWTYCHKALGSCNICGSSWITEWPNYEKYYWVMSVNKVVRSVWNKNKMGIVNFGQLKKKTLPCLFAASAVALPHMGTLNSITLSYLDLESICLGRSAKRWTADSHVGESSSGVSDARHHTHLFVGHSLTSQRWMNWWRYLQTNNACGKDRGIRSSREESNRSLPCSQGTLQNMLLAFRGISTPNMCENGKAFQLKLLLLLSSSSLSSSSSSHYEGYLYLYS